jgi:hypothetical protein
MSLGGPGLKQHVVEFVRGVGVITDGVTDSTDTTSPWTWIVPGDVAQLFITGCGAGGGGGGGHNATAARAGGGGGGSGMSVINLPVNCYPGSSLTITVGAGGPGGAANTNGTAGDPTTIAGLPTRSMWCQAFESGVDGTLRIHGSDRGRAGTASSGGLGGAGGFSTLANVAAGASGVANTGSPAAPSNATITGTSVAAFTVAACGGGGGGGASTTGATTAGSNGGRISGTNNPFNLIAVGAGGQDGTFSSGGGGTGGVSIFGVPGAGGGNATNTSQTGGNATGYGAGGGGGGGNGAGGDGADGYLQIVYWSTL